MIPVEHRPRDPAARAFDLRDLWFGPQQDLLVITKDAKGKVAEKKILPAAFVPLIEEQRDGHTQPRATGPEHPFRAAPNANERLGRHQRSGPGKGHFGPTR